MKKLFWALLFAGLFFANSAFCASQSVKYYPKNVDGLNVNIVEIDLLNQKIIVTPVVAKNFPGGTESFDGIISGSKPIAAINGTFFCTKSFEPVGDIVINRQLVNFAGLGTAMAITPGNDVDFIKVKRWRHMDWSRYMTVIASGPRLLDNGVIVLNPASEGFKDPRLFAIRNRSAIGVTADKKMLFVTAKRGISLRRLAQAMKLLGCVDAMNLDGGGSSGLFFDGKIITRPSYDLTNIIAVYEVQSGFKKNLADAANKKIKLFSLVLEKEGNSFAIKGLKDNTTFAELNVGQFPRFEDTKLELFSYVTVKRGPSGVVFKSSKDDRVFAIMKSEGDTTTIIFPLSKGTTK